MAKLKLTDAQKEYLKSKGVKNQDELLAKHGAEARREFADLGKNDALGSTSKNVGKSSQVVVPTNNSTRDVSMVSKDSAVKPVIEAEKKVDQLKMQPNPNKVALAQAEQDVTDTTAKAEQSLQDSPNVDSAPETILDNPDVANSDEGQVAQAAIDSGDVSQLGTITDPEGNPVLNGHFNENGEWVPYVKAEVEDPRVFSRPMALALTIISAALFTISGGLVPPINFMDLDGQDDYIANVNKVNQDYADLVNGTATKRNENRAGIESTEMNLESAANSPELYSRENTDALARGKAAEAGNVALEQTEMNADLAKALKERDIDLNLTTLKLSQEQQIKMANLLYDQSVNEVINKVKALKQSGMSNDQIAKTIQSMQGVTTLQRGLGYAKDITGMASDLVDSVGEVVSSDKNVKSYTTRNNDFLRRNKVWN